jgi:hypothetical protein
VTDRQTDERERKRDVGLRTIAREEGGLLWLLLLLAGLALGSGYVVPSLVFGRVI